MRDNEFRYYDLTDLERSEAQIYIWADPDNHPWSVDKDLGCAQDWPPGPWDDDYAGIPDERPSDEMQ